MGMDHLAVAVKHLDSHLPVYTFVSRKRASLTIFCRDELVFGPESSLRTIKMIGCGLALVKLSKLVLLRMLNKIAAAGHSQQGTTESRVPET